MEIHGSSLMNSNIFNSIGRSIILLSGIPILQEYVHTGVDRGTSVPIY